MSEKEFSGKLPSAGAGRHTCRAIQPGCATAGVRARVNVSIKTSRKCVLDCGLSAGSKDCLTYTLEIDLSVERIWQRSRICALEDTALVLGWLYRKPRFQKQREASYHRCSTQSASLGLE